MFFWICAGAEGEMIHFVLMQEEINRIIFSAGHLKDSTTSIDRFVHRFLRKLFSSLSRYDFPQSYPERNFWGIIVLQIQDPNEIANL